MKTSRRWPWVLAGVAIGLIYAAALGAWIVLAVGWPDGCAGASPRGPSDAGVPSPRVTRKRRGEAHRAPRRTPRKVA